MIKHIVMWTVKDQEGDMDKVAILGKMKRDLEALAALIPQVREIEVGINVKPDPNAYDAVLYSTFDSLEALDAYQKHPEHVKIAQFIGKVRKDRAVVDYECS